MEGLHGPWPIQSSGWQEYVNAPVWYRRLYCHARDAEGKLITYEIRRDITEVEVHHTLFDIRADHDWKDKLEIIRKMREDIGL